jgi:hypothetical protein
LHHGSRLTVARVQAQDLSELGYCLSFRKHTREGVVICGLNPMWQYFARAPQFEKMTLIEFHSLIKARAVKPSDGEVERSDDHQPDMQILPEGALAHQREPLFRDNSPVDEAADGEPVIRGATNDDGGIARPHGDDERDDGDQGG